MALILNIETATTACSVSLAKDGQLLHFIEYDNGYSHAENLHPFIQQLLKESNTHVNALKAIAVSKGPGSYTGLRIGVSAAKGLAYAMNVPLISVDTLQTMSVAAREKLTDVSFFCPMIDARRMEVYTSVYDKNLVAQQKIEALIINETSIEQFKKYQNICFFGNGYLKAKDILSQIPGSSFLESVQPSAKNMIELSFNKYVSKDFENVNYFEPFYLKDFLILKKK